MATMYKEEVRSFNTLNKETGEIKLLENGFMPCDKYNPDADVLNDPVSAVCYLLEKKGVAHYDEKLHGYVADKSHRDNLTKLADEAYSTLGNVAEW